MIYRGPSSHAVVCFGSSPLPPVSKLDRRHTGRLRKRDNMLTGGGEAGVYKECRLSWLTNSTLEYDPKCGGGGWGVAGSQPMRTAVHRSPNKLWRSNSIWWRRQIIRRGESLVLHTPFNTLCSKGSSYLACQEGGMSGLKMMWWILYCYHRLPIQALEFCHHAFFKLLSEPNSSLFSRFYKGWMFSPWAWKSPKDV